MHTPMASQSPLLTTIHVVRMIGGLLRSLQSPVISPQTLNALDSHFAACQSAFPPECHIYHPQPLQPRYLSPICQLQNCRIVLHRHNLSTSCPPDVRAAALRSCLHVAKETAHLLSRVRQWKPQAPTPAPIAWGDAVASTAGTTMVCTHIWRCTLFLCFSALYDEALTCAHLCAAIGNFRQANLACARYLCGFLRQLAAKTAHGGDLMQDEMMIALVAGDVQGSSESAWIWSGSETGTALNNSSNSTAAATTTSTSITTSSSSISSSSSSSSSNTTNSSTNNNNHISHINDNSTNGTSPPMHTHANGKPDLSIDDGGWDSVQQMIRQLKLEKERREFQPWDPQMNSMPAAASGNNSSRISIANII